MLHVSYIPNQKRLTQVLQCRELELITLLKGPPSFDIPRESVNRQIYTD